MKKLFIVLLLSLIMILGACSSETETESELTLQDFINAYEAEGIEVNPEEKPIFSLIKAVDGVIFYVDNNPVKIYEYSSTKDIEAGEDALPAISDWNKNGRFVLETSNEKAIEIFNSVSDSAVGKSEGADTTEEQSSVEPVEKVVQEEPKTPIVKVDETFIIEDYAEITIKGNDFGKVIEPPNPDSFYTYYENKEVNQTYLDTVISVKSLLTTKKSSDEFLKVKIIYDDKYEYETFATIEEQGGSNFTYTNITTIEPLQNGILHFLASLPLESENDGKSLKAVITVNGDTYEQIIR